MKLILTVGALAGSLVLGGCGRFSGDPLAGAGLSTAANPVTAEHEDMIKLAATKEVPTNVAALFAREMKQSDSKLLKDSRVRAAIASIDRLNSVILKRRIELLRLQAQMNTSKSLSGAEAAWITTLATEFKTSAVNMTELRNRVDEWPAIFVLAGVVSARGHWPTENALGERLEFLNTSSKAEIVAVRARRAVLVENSQMTSREKTAEFTLELTKSMSASTRTELLKTVNELSSSQLLLKSVEEFP